MKSKNFLLNIKFSNSAVLGLSEKYIYLIALIRK